MPTPALPRIAFFLLDLSGGGIERVNLNLANELAARGYPVDLVLVRRRGEFVHRVGDRVNTVVLDRTRAYECVWPLRQYLRSARPGVLISCFPTLNLVAILANLLSGNVTRVLPVEHMPVSVDRRENPSRLPRFAYALYPFFYRMVPVVGVNCEESAQDFKQQFPSLASRVRVLYNPVVSCDIEKLGKAVPAQGPLAQVPLKRPVLVGAGRLTRQKNFPLLLKAFALVREKLECDLVIVGGRGEDRERLLEIAQELNISEHIQWTGFVDNPYAYFSRASVFVLSSIYETLPTVLVEALACGSPVVATDCFGVREILLEGKLGEIVPDFEPIHLAQAILRTLCLPADSAVLRDRARAFSVTSASDQYARLIHELNT
jgi:glycosyltransferase involved in cell wall biosynthesis